MLSDEPFPKHPASRRDGPEKFWLAAALASLLVLSTFWMITQLLRPVPIQYAGMKVDRLSAVTTLLVALVGFVAFRFSCRHLEGEPGQGRFRGWLFTTVVSAYVLMLSSNLLLLLGAWSLTSLGLHALLLHYGDRAEARRPARKKFLISRLGDIALVLAILLIYRAWGVVDLDGLSERVRAGVASDWIGPVATLIVVAALTKSAQFPFHSWLPETMEAPTPVSALMHAGIINAGGVLLIRFAPLLTQAPAALLLLSVVGTTTALLGLVATWAQTKVKRTLAWSTVAQMGFMMIQCGVAAFPAALLHIVGHGCYKAWSFLMAGQLPTPAPARKPLSSAGRLLRLGIGCGMGTACLAAACPLADFDPLHSPGELALCAILVLAIGQLWTAFVDRPTVRAIAGVTIATALVAVGALVLYRGADHYLAPVLGDVAAPTGLMGWAAATLPVAGLAIVSILHALLPTLSNTPSGRALFVHALNGFYFGAVADRCVDAVWNYVSPPEKEVVRA